MRRSAQVGGTGPATREEVLFFCLEALSGRSPEQGGWESSILHDGQW